MTKADLVEQVTAAMARTSGPLISKKDCARVVDAFLDAMHAERCSRNRAMRVLAEKRQSTQVSTKMLRS